MPAYPETVIVLLCERFRVEPRFLVQCLEESVVEIHEVEGRWDLSNGTALRLRQMERLCFTLNVDVLTAKRFLELTERVADLEEEVRQLRGHHATPPLEFVIDHLIRSRRRTLGLQITADAQLIVRAPKWVSLTEITNAVQEKLAWIRKKQIAARQRQAERVTRRFEDGESFLYLGEWRRLRVIPQSEQELAFDGTDFRIGEGARLATREQFDHWYRDQAHEVMNERVRFFSQRSGLIYTSLRISEAKTRWGSCSSKGTLNLSRRLIMAPLWVIDYVVSHELAHLVEHNHSHRFWKRVAALFPDFQTARRWLRANQHHLEI